MSDSVNRCNEVWIRELKRLMNKEEFEQMLLEWIEFFEMERRDKGILPF